MRDPHSRSVRGAPYSMLFVSVRCAALTVLLSLCSADLPVQCEARQEKEAYVSKEKVVDLGELEITKDNQHTLNWQLHVGIGTMVIGGGVLILIGRNH